MSDNPTQNAQTGPTSTDVEPVTGPGQNAQSTTQARSEDPSSAPEQDSQSQVPSDPRPLNEGQPEQPDARG